MLVHAIISDWYSGLGCCHMASGQIFVVTKILNLGAVSLLFMFLNVCHETYHI